MRMALYQAFPISDIKIMHGADTFTEDLLFTEDLFTLRPQARNRVPARFCAS
jgi:hypothetical protein